MVPCCLALWKMRGDGCEFIALATQSALATKPEGKVEYGVMILTRKILIRIWV